MEEEFAASQEGRHRLDNSTPETLIRLGISVAEFLETYGWFIVIVVIAAMYLIEKLIPYFNRWKSKWEDYSNKKTDDPNEIYHLHESMENSRRKLQEKIDRDAERAKERRQQLEAEKRREKIEDWERHQLGQGFRSKVKKPQEDPTAQDSTKPKPKPKKPLRPNDYNPLMGPGGSCGYRPSPRGGQSGGG